MSIAIALGRLGCQQMCLHLVSMAYLKAYSLSCIPMAKDESAFAHTG